MHLQRPLWILFGITTLALLTSCAKPKEEGCPTCFYDYQKRYAIHGCHTQYNQTCWVNCNTCSTEHAHKHKPYWQHASTPDKCRDFCCNCLK